LIDSFDAGRFCNRPAFSFMQASCHSERSEESIRLSAGDFRPGSFAALLTISPGLSS
jgi:hypothetical protein